MRLPWSAYTDGTHIRLTQSKSKRRGAQPARVTIPVGAPLKARRNAEPKRSTIILTNTEGAPWTSDGLRASWPPKIGSTRFRRFKCASRMNPACVINGVQKLSASLLAQIKRHENAVRILHIIVEWLTFDEAVFPIQGNCGLEIIP